MTNRSLILLTLFVVAALAGVSVWAWHVLPADARLPLHWNAAGEIDNYGSKTTALSFPPGFALVMAMILWGTTKIEPRQQNLAGSRAIIAVVWVGMLGLAALIEWLVVGTALHRQIAAGPLLIGALGLTFVFLGNQLSKSRQMLLIGIRTPWTRADPDIWTATHRLGGKLMMLAGLVWLVAALAGLVNALTMPILVLVMMAASLVPVVYSYLLWRKRHRA